MVVPAAVKSVFPTTSDNVTWGDLNRGNQKPSRKDGCTAAFHWCGRGRGQKYVLAYHLLTGSCGALPPTVGSRDRGRGITGTLVFVHHRLEGGDSVFRSRRQLLFGTRRERNIIGFRSGRDPVTGFYHSRSANLCHGPFEGVPKKFACGAGPPPRWGGVGTLLSIGLTVTLACIFRASDSFVRSGKEGVGGG